MRKRSILLLVLAFLFLIVVAVVVVLAISIGAAGKGRMADKILLEVDFETAVLEYLPDDPVAQLSLKETPRIHDLVEALGRAATDDRVVGLIARVGQGGMGFAQLQEVRDAVLAFRAGGKPAYAWAETFGELASGNGSYYLASAFDKIYLQQSGDVGMTGLMVESPFVRGMLEKLGLEPRMDHRHEFKNAKNMYTETSYTEAHEEAMRTLMTSIFDQLVTGMAEGRGMTPEQLRQLFAAGPYFGQEAVDNGLVDALAYRDEAYDAIRGEVDEDAELLYLGAYLENAGGLWEDGDTIALIFGVGGITRGPSRYNPLSGGMTMGSDTVSAAFRAAVDDDDVKAILFRVDCSGGSYVASDAVLRETQRARAAGKPVIVSMGNVAASGGYFVAMAADKIVAQPGTITGSIGVLGGKLLTSGMWEKIGISWDSVETSANGTMWTGTHDYSPEQWARYTAWLDRVYDDFTGKVAEGRGLPLEKVQEIARGRVWTGVQAKERGLVDELGGYTVALRLAREAAGLAADAAVHLRVFPRPRTPWQQFFDDGPQSSDQAAAVAVVRVLESVRPVVLLAERAGLLEPVPRTLMLPPEMDLRP